MPLAVAASLDRALEALLPFLDVVEERAESAEPPAWCERRGWTAFLLGLSDEQLARAESEGIATALDHTSEGAPEDLIAMVQLAGEATRLPTLDARSAALSTAALRQVSERKGEQLGALLGALESLAAPAARIVDVGAGKGHLTRLAAELFGREALGIERDRDRVEAARARVAESPSRAHFLATDACTGELSFESSDLALGLHACGEVGDALVVAAASAGCALALVSCCPQKIAADHRVALSRRAGALVLSRPSLGLANLTAQPVGVETTLARSLEARQARYGLYALLRARGVELALGEELRGINRRRAHGGLSSLAERVLALRGLAPATAAEISHYKAVASRDYAMMRRLSLPRSALARLVEVTIVLDRAALLIEQGLCAEVATLFEPGVSPRNVGLFASPRAEDLPRLGASPANGF